MARERVKINTFASCGYNLPIYRLYTYHGLEQPWSKDQSGKTKRPPLRLQKANIATFPLKLELQNPLMGLVSIGQGLSRLWLARSSIFEIGTNQSIEFQAAPVSRHCHGIAVCLLMTAVENQPWQPFGNEPKNRSQLRCRIGKYEWKCQHHPWALWSVHHFLTRHSWCWSSLDQKMTIATIYIYICLFIYLYTIRIVIIIIK